MSNSENTKTATDDNFEAEVLKSPKLTMVDFWAEWCGPCKTLGPTVDSLADEFTTNLKVYKMDVDANPTIPAKFNIRGIPTLLFFKDGKLVDQLVGAHPKGRIAETIQKHI